MNMINNDEQMKSFFEQLPKSLQENIVQSGVDVQSLEQLQAIAAKLVNDEQ